MKNDYFHRIANLTPTKMWINNVTPKEAEMAIDAGARGCTQNPSYPWKMLNHPEEKENAKKVLLETMAEYEDANEVVCVFQRKLISVGAKVFMPLYMKTNGEYGYVSIQGDPIHEEDPDVIIKEARINWELSPNNP